MVMSSGDHTSATQLQYDFQTPVCRFRLFTRTAEQRGMLSKVVARSGASLRSRSFSSNTKVHFPTCA